MRNKGFTLAELLGVIVILALISLITVPAITNSLQDYKARLCNTQLEEIVAAARVWGADNILKLPTDDGETYTISLETLVQSGYIGADIQNPITNEKFDADKITVTITRTGKKYTYEIDDDTKKLCEA